MIFYFDDQSGYTDISNPILYPYDDSSYAVGFKVKQSVKDRINRDPDNLEYLFTKIEGLEDYLKTHYPEYFI
jgi:hypothetical protein